MAKKKSTVKKIVVEKPVEKLVEKVIVKEPVKGISGVKCHRCGNNDMQLEKDVSNEKVYFCTKCTARLSKMC